MGNNWIEDFDENSREYDRQVRAGAEKYDKELYAPQSGCCGGEEDEPDENETDEDEEE